MPTPRDPLSTTLQTWRHEPAPAPDFESGVWNRIRTAEASATAPAASSPFAALAAFFRFPALQPLAAGLALLLALAAGTTTAVAINRVQTTDRLATAYVRSIDPLQMNAAPDHAHHP